MIEKWKARTIAGPNPVQNPNPNPNPNLNVQMIDAEPREPSVVVVTRGGVATKAD